MKKLKTYRELQFENALVRVWKTIVSPGESLEFDRLDTGQVIVSLKGGKLKRIEANGSQSDLHFDTHKAYWLEADGPHGMHGDINESDEPIEIMVVEMKLPTNSPLPSIPLE